MSTDSHYRNIRIIRAEQAQVEAEIAERKKRLCLIRSQLLSEVEALQAEHIFAARKIDPCRELAAARGRATGVSDA